MKPKLVFWWGQQNWQTSTQIQQENRDGAQIHKIKNEKEVTIDGREIQKVIRDYYEQSHTNKMDNLE